MNFFQPPQFGSQQERYIAKNRNNKLNVNQQIEGWEVVEKRNVSEVPCQRSLHAGAVWKNNFVVFGGYDGRHRVNDLHAFNFDSQMWNLLDNKNAPSPRDRHVATVFENSLYIFGGFDGAARINDLHEYDLELNEWRMVELTSGAPPTPRHSHAAVVYQTSMFVFGGYDGSYRNDFHEFNFVTRSWSQVHSSGDTPRARYRGTCVVSGDNMILHGGHDGNRHLQDTYIFDFKTQTWRVLVTEGEAPSPRDSHVSVIFGKSMFLYGGSTGNAMGDFHELKLEFRSAWHSVAPKALVETNVSAKRGSVSASYDSNRSTPVRGGGGAKSYSSKSVSSSPVNMSTLAIDTAPLSVDPGPRFCHVGVVYDSAFYIFGGYDGTNRLNDFLRFRFDVSEPASAIAPSTLIPDLKKFVNSDLLSDIRFIVEDQVVYAHKILCLRCPYFHNMLTGEYMESRASEIPIPDVKHSTFLLLLEYLYSDEVDVTIDTAMDLFQVADRFGIDRLKNVCEQEMLSAINVETAAHILFMADERNAENLRERCMSFILVNFDAVSKTQGFEVMGHTNVHLVFEVLKRR